jgi:hypothetical protein
MKNRIVGRFALHLSFSKFKVAIDCKKAIYNQSSPHVLSWGRLLSAGPSEFLKRHPPVGNIEISKKGGCYYD